jgi:D-aspartate ligase
MNTRPLDAVVIGGFGQLRPLVAAGLRPWVVPTTEGASIRRSRHFRDSGLVVPELPRQEKVFLASLLAFAARFASPPVLFYGDDTVLGFVVRHHAALRSAFAFEMPDARLVEACLDKTRFARLGEEKGLPVPRQLVGSPGLDARMIQREIGFPCALKPAIREGFYETSAGGKPQKILRVDTLEECEAGLEAVRRHTNRFVVQEFIPGGEDLIFSFHAYVPSGDRPRASYIGRKLRTYPSMGGESTAVRLIEDDQLTRLGWQMVDRLGLTGVMKIDFKRHAETGRYYILEVNLRCSLWTQLGARCGVNLAEYAYRDQCGLPYAPPSAYRTDVRWIHVPRDVKTFLREYRRKGLLSYAAWLGSYLRPKTYAAFAWSDPLPAALQLAGKLRRRPEKTSGPAPEPEPWSLPAS